GSDRPNAHYLTAERQRGIRAGAGLPPPAGDSENDRRARPLTKTVERRPPSAADFSREAGGRGAAAPQVLSLQPVLAVRAADVEMIILRTMAAEAVAAHALRQIRNYALRRVAVAEVVLPRFSIE